MNDTYTASPAKIKAYLDRFVIGQDEAKKDLAMLGFLHQIRILMDKDKEFPPTEGWKKPLTGLIVGPTGCGKTYLLKLLARSINVPLLSVNAAEMTNVGYVGNTFSDLVSSALSKVSYDYPYEAQDRAIIFVDEFDKICSGLNHDGWSRRMQDSLLAPIEGQRLGSGNRTNHTGLDLSKMMVVLGGSFRHLVDKRTKEKVVYGFVKNEDKKDLEKITQAELIESGVIRELAGRIHTVTQVYPLTKNQLYKILEDTEENVIRDYNRLFKFLGEREATELEIDMIVNVASIENEKKGNDLGARALVNAANKVFRKRLEDSLHVFTPDDNTQE